MRDQVHMLKSRRSLITGILSGLEVDAAQFVWGSKPFASDQVESAFALLSRQVGGVILFRRIPKKSPPTDRFMNMNKLAFSPQSLYLDVPFYGHVWAKCRTAIMDCFVRETPSQVPSHTTATSRPLC
jgi:hypothetical protein